MKKTKSFIIKILHSAKCFRPGDFFQSTLEFNLTKTKDLGDLVYTYGKNLVLMCNGQDLDHKNDVKFVSRLLGIGDPICSFDPNIEPDVLMAFWDGDRYESLGSLADQNAPFIAKHIEEANEKKIIVLKRYPNFKFIAKQKLQSLKFQNKPIPTYDEALDKAIEFYKESSALRNLLSRSEDQGKPVNPDTGVEYTKDEEDERYNLLRASEFNCNLWKAMAQELPESA